MNKKLSDKDKRDWEKFLQSEDKVENKDLHTKKENISKNLIRTIDLHGFTLESANIEIDKFIRKCFKDNVNKICVITGKGSRSKNTNNPYVSKDLSILKYSIPEFIKTNKDLMKMIKEINETEVQNLTSGSFSIFLKNFKE